MFQFKTFVRYSETDQMGVVYYANYFVYFEAARTALLKNEGKPYSEFEKRGIFLPVVEAYCKYNSPVFYEDEIIVNCWVSEVKNTSFKFEYEILRENEIVARGYTRHCTTDKNLKPIKIPEDLKKIIEKYKR
jgi:acyl-CoA thioester hydrolase